MSCHVDDADQNRQIPIGKFDISYHVDADDQDRHILIGKFVMSFHVMSRHVYAADQNPQIPIVKVFLCHVMLKRLTKFSRTLIIALYYINFAASLQQNFGRIQGIIGQI